ILYTAVYVFPLYATKTTRPSRTLSRDSPQVIRSRIVSVALSTVLCNVASYIFISRISSWGRPDALAFMGYWPAGWSEAARTIALNSMLFAGPLFETLLIDGEWRTLVNGRAVAAVWSDWTTWRNIVVGPATEEALFRSAAVPLFVLAGISPVKTIFLTPVVFGLAHVHHFYEHRISYPNVPVVHSILRSAFQFAFTSLFGALATFFFLRTRSFLAVTLLHAQCNALGLPRLSGSVCPYWLPLNTPANSTSVRMWTAAYYVVLISGVVAWYKNLWTLSYSPQGLY
ncbi:hypothetical protein TD95_001593, partial [Thielaviopsis punctulata]